MALHRTEHDVAIVGDRIGHVGGGVTENRSPLRRLSSPPPPAASAHDGDQYHRPSGARPKW